MQEPSVIIRQKQYAKQATNKRLLSDMCICMMIRSNSDMSLAKYKNLEYISLLQSRAMLC